MIFVCLQIWFQQPAADWVPYPFIECPIRDLNKRPRYVQMTNVWDTDRLVEITITRRRRRRYPASSRLIFLLVELWLKKKKKKRSLLLSPVFALISNLNRKGFGDFCRSLIKKKILNPRLLVGEKFYSFMIGTSSVQRKENLYLYRRLEVVVSLIITELEFLLPTNLRSVP